MIVGDAMPHTLANRAKPRNRSIFPSSGVSDVKQQVLSMKRVSGISPSSASQFPAIKTFQLIGFR